MNAFKFFFYLLCFNLLLIACKSEEVAKQESVINIRIPKDPEKLNPVFNPTSLAREVFQYVFVPVADFHPDDLALTPILIEALPTTVTDREGLIGYQMKFKKDAQWPNGSPIKAEDYAFTIKAVKHPNTNARAWRSYVNFIKDVVIDENDEQKFTVYVDENYMLSKEVACTIYILPKYAYDPDGKLNAIKIADLNKYESALTLVEQDSTLTQFATDFNNPINYRDHLISCGPYEISGKESGQFYSLKKKSEYWGNAYTDNPFLNNKMDEIIFKIIPDEVAALTALKDGSIDMMNLKSATEFDALKEERPDDFQYFSPQLMRMQYIALNNENPKLEDKRVRQALAHLLDVNDIITTIDQGYGIRSIGPFHPSKSYYNKSLTPRAQDIALSKQLLKDAGWSDSDNDGDLDQVIDGKLVDLELEFLCSGSELATKVGLLFQDAAKEAGVKINVVGKKYRLIRKENLTTGNFDMVAALTSSDAAPDDPYAYWHSESTDPGEQNVFGYKSTQADTLIEAIRLSRNETERKELYLELQEVLYEDQPVIFLYAPLGKVLLNNKFEGSTTAKRPGYLANTFSLR